MRYVLTIFIVLTFISGSLHAAKPLEDNLWNLPQCDYSNPDYCYEMLRLGWVCGSGSGGYSPYSPDTPYTPYTPYSPVCPPSPYNPYNPYSPYNPYAPHPYSPYHPYMSSADNFFYSNILLKIRFQVDDIQYQSGFIGMHQNKIFYSPDLQRLFEPYNELD